MRNLFMKDEGHDGDGRMIGPLYWFDPDEPQTFPSSCTPYEENKEFGKIGDKYPAKWFNLKQAKAIAKKEGVELEC